MSGEPKMASVRYDTNDQTGSQRFLERAKREPFVPIGIAACLGSLAYAVVSFKHKRVPTTIWVQQMRVQAQGMIVGAIIMGVGMKMWQQRKEKKLTESS